MILGMATDLHPSEKKHLIMQRSYQPKQKLATSAFYKVRDRVATQTEIERTGALARDS